ncbi:hypothetical protein VNO77_09387 [Canavalia gladiata]|uniref:Uncharacterized protein n=1 Tax=Canavalia gladiata TaxID=3824 RepID=A0AAN9M9V5_CANGL
MHDHLKEKNCSFSDSCIVAKPSVSLYNITVTECLNHVHTKRKNIVAAKKGMIMETNNPKQRHNLIVGELFSSTRVAISTPLSNPLRAPITNVTSS